MHRIKNLVCAAAVLLLTGCGAPDEMKQKANDLEREYSPVFEQYVLDIYGDNTKLTNIDCSVNMRIGSPVPDVTYSVSDKLTGKLHVGDKAGHAVYKIANDTVYDDLFADEICDSIIDKLPFVSSQFYSVKFIDSMNMTPMFKSGTRSYDECVSSDDCLSLYNNLRLYIITSEDLSVYKDIDFANGDFTKDTLASSCPVQYVVVSVKSEHSADTLFKYVDRLNFDYHDKPTVYWENGADAFSTFGINNSIAVTYYNGEASCRYHDKDL